MIKNNTKKSTEKSARVRLEPAIPKIIVLHDDIFNLRVEKAL